MVKIILILALLQYIYNFIFGYKSNILGCGIFGQATNKPENLDVNAVHILGIFNIERGKMSCGLSWDGDIQYGIGVDKLYTNFITNRNITPTKIPIIIGHTRQPSYGFTVTEDNAHPFGFGTSKNGEGYEMIFCHNGTLKNHKELASKYNIDLTEKVVKQSHGGHKYESTRDKIDSEILGEILYRTKKFHVLSEYIGAAALAWTWIDEPNKLYLWSGSSKSTKGAKYGGELEERPMNVYCKNENTMFFSSIADSLTVLGAKKVDMQIDYNTVYIITDGDFENAEKHKVSRKQAGQAEETFNYTNGYHHHGGRNSYLPDSEYCDWDSRSTSSVKSMFTSKPQTAFSTIDLREDKPLKPVVDYKDKVYSKSLRYWKNGVLITGIYIYIKNWGFYFLNDNYEDAIKSITWFKGLSFDYDKGEFVTKNSGNVPIPEDLENEHLQLYYFKTGVMLKTLADYERLKIYNMANPTQPNPYLENSVLSHISKHPIINLTSANVKSVAFLEGKPFTGAITELGFEKVYTFKDGLLTKWVKREDLVINTSPVIILPQVQAKEAFNKILFDKAIKDIEDAEIVDKELLDEQFINELIADTFQKHSEEVTETIIQLSDWDDNKDVATALHTLKLISHTLKDFIETPNKK